MIEKAWSPSGCVRSLFFESFSVFRSCRYGQGHQHFTPGAHHVLRYVLPCSPTHSQHCSQSALLQIPTRLERSLLKTFQVFSFFLGKRTKMLNMALRSLCFSFCVTPQPSNGPTSFSRLLYSYWGLCQAFERGLILFASHSTHSLLNTHSSLRTNAIL